MYKRDSCQKNFLTRQNEATFLAGDRKGKANISHAGGRQNSFSIVTK